MIRILPPLSALSVVLLMLPGCITTPVSSRPSQKAPVTSPPPAPLPAFVPSQKRPLPPAPASVGLSPSPCRSVLLSSSASRLSFVMTGHGDLEKTRPRKVVLDLAEKDALARVEGCAEPNKGLSLFYDRTWVPDPRDPGRISRLIRRALVPRPHFRTVSEACQEEGDRQSCQVTIEGTLRAVRQDSRFRILSAGPGRAGPFREGDSMKIRFSLTKNGWVFLFDVDRKRGARLLFPGAPFPDENNRILSGKSFVFPPESQTAIRLVAALPPGLVKKIGHLWVIALRRPDWPELSVLAQGKPDGSGRISSENFFAKILPSLGTRTPPGGWTLRVIPYEVLQEKGMPPPQKTHHFRP